MPSDSVHWIVVAFEDIEFLFALPDVKNFDLGVFAPGQKPVPINWVPSHLRHCVVVRLNRVDALASRARVKDLDVGVLAPREDQAVKRVPVAGLDIAAVVLKDKLGFGRRKIKNFSGVVISAGNELQTRIREAEVVDRSFLMRSEGVLLFHHDVAVDDFAVFVA